MPNTKTVDGFNNEKLKRLIKEKGITRSQLAEQLGISNSHFDRICDGTKNPSLPLFKLLCLTLEVNAADFKKEVQAPATQPAQSQIGMIMDIQRTVKETKAETELVRGDLNSCFEKLTTVSSNTGKIYGKLKAMEK